MSPIAFSFHSGSASYFIRIAFGELYRYQCDRPYQDGPAFSAYPTIVESKKIPIPEISEKC